MGVQQGEGKAREVTPQPSKTAKRQSTSPGKSPGKPPNIAPAKFCKRERGGICPGNCNACLLQYLFGQYQ
jgi:hypothetical protein